MKKIYLFICCLSLRVFADLTMEEIMEECRAGRIPIAEIENRARAGDSQALTCVRIFHDRERLYAQFPQFREFPQGPNEIHCGWERFFTEFERDFSCETSVRDAHVIVYGHTLSQTKKRKDRERLQSLFGTSPYYNFMVQNKTNPFQVPALMKAADLKLSLEGLECLKSVQAMKDRNLLRLLGNGKSKKNIHDTLLRELREARDEDTISALFGIIGAYSYLTYDDLKDIENPVILKAPFYQRQGKLLKTLHVLELFADASTKEQRLTPKDYLTLKELMAHPLHRVTQSFALTNCAVLAQDCGDNLQALAWFGEAGKDFEDSRKHGDREMNLGFRCYINLLTHIFSVKDTPADQQETLLRDSEQYVPFIKAAGYIGEFNQLKKLLSIRQEQTERELVIDPNHPNYLSVIGKNVQINELCKKMRDEELAYEDRARYGLQLMSLYERILTELPEENIEGRAMLESTLKDVEDEVYLLYRLEADSCTYGKKPLTPARHERLSRSFEKIQRLLSRSPRWAYDKLLIDFVLSPRLQSDSVLNKISEDGSFRSFRGLERSVQNFYASALLTKSAHTGSDPGVISTQLEMAKHFFKILVEKDPSNCQKKRLAYVLGKLGAHDEASLTFTGDEHTATLLKYNQWLFQSCPRLTESDYEQMLKILIKVVEDNPTSEGRPDDGVCCAIGRLVLHHTKNDAQAADWCEQALRINPQNAHAQDILEKIAKRRQGTLQPAEESTLREGHEEDGVDRAFLDLSRSMSRLFVPNRRPVAMAAAACADEEDTPDYVTSPKALSDIRDYDTWRFVRSVLGKTPADAQARKQYHVDDLSGFMRKLGCAIEGKRVTYTEDGHLVAECFLPHTFHDGNQEDVYRGGIGSELREFLERMGFHS